MTSRICKHCEAELSPENFYDSYKSLCKKCVTAEVSNKRRKRATTPDEEDIELGVSEILEPENKDDLYVMKNDRLPEYKVGRSHDPAARAKDLSTCQNFRMEILHVFKGQGHLESICHQRLKARKFTEGRGNEWFNLDLQTIETIIKGVIAESQLSAFYV